ncbi:diadenylate cyclase [Desulfohalotomaculum tongense]|uniref:diadenylate cyclase CdaA n=1 Tax=Desulforadius tongensis TaxID=1216062 RepID=UPI0019581F5A|nr:diadenylate cyclase CdaA [Desulforadius tongensis]MBM7853892.1 diadenylate cyclase [Desulforadius tongensis]
MLDQFNWLNLNFAPFNLINLLDIFIVALVLYKLMLIIKGTRAVQLIKGIVVLLVATTVSSWLELYTINWLLRQTMTALVVALPIVFQPELRRALEQLGRGKFFARSFINLGEEDRSRMINEVVRAVQVLSKNSIGALIVIERVTGLEEYIDTGIKIDGVISSEFLINLFVPKTPLHDGACIIRGDRVAAAACFLPLTDAPLAHDLGTRHRAGVGITEYSDALAVIVSEETGTISLAQEGEIYRMLDETTLKQKLTDGLQPKSSPSFYNLWSKSGGS